MNTQFPWTKAYSLYESIIFKLLIFLFQKFRKNGEEMRDEKRTLECLKKAARIASQCMDTGVQVQICVELLNHYLFYFERGNSLITVDLLNQVCFQIFLINYTVNEYVLSNNISFTLTAFYERLSQYI